MAQYKYSTADRPYRRRRPAMSCGWPVLWLSTNAVQLTVPIGDDGQLMSCGWPVLWLSTHAVQMFLRLRRAIFLFFCVPFFSSSNFSVPFPFVKLFRSFALQPFPFLCHCSVMLFRLFRCYTFPLFRCPFRLFNASRQDAGGGVFRSITNFLGPFFPEKKVHDC